MTSITLASGSQFTNLQIPGIPVIIPANGQQLVSGTVNVPNTQGLAHLYLQIQSQTTVADCTGTTPHCNLPQLLAVDVNVGQGGGNTCTISLDKTTFVVTSTTSDSTTARAVCKDASQNVVACPALTWQSSIQPPPTPPYDFNPNPTPSKLNPTSAFTVHAGTTAQSGKTVTATDPTASVTCNTIANVQVQQGGGVATYCALTVPSPIAPGVPTQVAADCKDINGAVAACPKLGWSVAFNPSGSGLFNPNPTSSMVHPTTDLTVDPSTPIGATGTVSAQEQGGSLTCPGKTFTVGSGEGGGIQLSCGFLNHPSPDFFPGDSATVQTTCTDNGQPTGCPPLTWDSSQIQGSSMNPAHTPPPTGSQPTSTFKIDPAALVPQLNKQIQISCDPPAVCNPAPCTVNVNLQQIPNRLDCSLTDHGNQFQSTDSGHVLGHCSTSVAPTACPQLQWKTVSNPIPNSDFTPNPTQQMVDPITLFATHNSPPSSGLIDADSISPNPLLQGLSCFARIGIMVGQGGGLAPDYTVVNVTPSDIFPMVGDTITFTVNIKNIGTAPGGALSRTFLHFDKDCTDQSDPQVPPLNIGQSYPDKDSFSCICRSPGIHIVTATADADNSLQPHDSNPNNNVRSAVFFCSSNTGPRTLTCADFV